MALLKDHVEVLHKIASALLEKETISGEDIDNIMAEMGIAPITLTPVHEASGLLKETESSAISNDNDKEDSAKTEDDENFTLEDK